MKINMKANIFISALLILGGCKGYIGGFDDSDIQGMQAVFINKSQHDLTLIINDEFWSSHNGPDTVRIEPVNGLTIFEYNDPYSSTGIFDEAALMIDGDKTLIHYDASMELPGNPCTYGFVKQINDSKRRYTVYEYTEERVNQILREYDRIKDFSMTSVEPSLIHDDSLIVEGSSEALFHRIYPVPAVRENLKVGALIAKEAESLDRLRFVGTAEVPADLIERSENGGLVSYLQECQQSYFSIHDLGKIGLAHFGCDFGKLTGRNKMEKFSGIMYSRAVSSEYEATYGITSVPEGTVAVRSVCYGKIMFLLAEADSSPRELHRGVKYAIICGDTSEITTYIDDPDSIDFHLITRDENGEFHARSGGIELLELYIEGPKNEPVFPLFFELTDGSDKTAYIHIQDIQSQS